MRKGWLAGEACSQWYRTRMAFTTLISTATLSMHLDEPAWVVIDCRFKLDDVAWGEREYAAGHIPGAIYAHLDRDLSASKTGTNGRHPLPEATTLSATFARFGIADGTQVVAYDQDSAMYASRLWWMLRYMGHDAVAGTGRRICQMDRRRARHAIGSGIADVCKIFRKAAARDGCRCEDSRLDGWGGLAISDPPRRAGATAIPRRNRDAR